MTRAELLRFMRTEKYAVQASVSPSGAPQAAVVGIVVTDAFEVFFDTLGTSRKAQHLRQNPAIALVIGSTAGDAAQTVQYEGLADEPSGPELERLMTFYCARFPDGQERQQWPDITFVRVRPTWIRYSNFAADPPEIVEFTAADLA